MPIVNFWVVKGDPRYPVPGVEERCGDIASLGGAISATMAELGPG